jgi:gamma-glutamyl-gamma-aminobutyrate hydrolase PuuD
MTAAPPRIGITTYREPARWGEWDQTADLLPVDYTTGVQDAGGVALLLPPAPAAQAAAALDGVHGLVVAGGPDIDPDHYGAARHPRTGAGRVERDGWELALVRAALDRDLPLLAICRGLQILNTALGGTLIQHLPDVVGTDLHSPVAGAFGRHGVDLDPDGRLAALCGTRCEIATHHHQAIDCPGAGLVVCGRADDGTIEAVEVQDRTWAFGVQWHPEAHAGEALFTGLVDAARIHVPEGARP